MAKISEFTFDAGLMRWAYPGNLPALEYNIGELPEYRDAVDEFAQSLVYNGIKQKIVDSAALPSPATVAEKHAAMAECIERLNRREWNAERTGSGIDSMLLAVLEHYYAGAKTRADCRTQMEPWSAAERRKVFYSDRLAKSRKSVEAARRPKDDGTADKLLGEMAAK